MIQKQLASYHDPLVNYPEELTCGAYGIHCFFNYRWKWTPDPLRAQTRLFQAHQHLLNKSR